VRNRDDILQLTAILVHFRCLFFSSSLLQNHHRLLSHLIADTDTYRIFRTPLDEGSARHRAPYLYKTQHLQETNIHAPMWYSNPQPLEASCTKPTL